MTAFGHAERDVADRLRDRFRGLLLGLAIGDALGVGVQFRKAGTFAPLADYVGGGPFELPRGAWSDDAATALHCAESLIETGALDTDDLVDRWRGWQRSGWGAATGRCVGISAALAGALADRESADARQATDGEPLPRVAVVAAFEFADPTAAQDSARAVASLTHPTPDVLQAVSVYARWISAVLQGEPAATLTSPDAPGGDAATAHGVVTWVVQAVTATTSFKDAVLRVVNAGGPADITGATVGALAGALYGAAGLPARWLAGLVDRQDIESCADRLLVAALQRMIADPPRPPP